MKWITKNPVLAFAMLVTLLGIAIGQLKAQQLVSDHVMEWLTFFLAVLTAGLGLITHQAIQPDPPAAWSVTTLASPTPAPVVTMNNATATWTPTTDTAAPTVPPDSSSPPFSS